MARKQHSTPPPFVLLIMDGWGIAPKSKANAIELAKKPHFDYLWKHYPHTELRAAGKDVGLPPDQEGNSEAGHMNIGAGRVVDQDSVAISKAINTGKFFKNPAFTAAHTHIKKNKSNLHIMGMLADDQSGHADPDHLLALLSWARMKKIKNVYLHLFTDGRDSRPHASLKLIEALMRQLKNQESGGHRSGEWIATITGRYYAMDRKKEWSRTEKAYDAMLLGKGLKAKSPQEAITQSYNRGETDEFIPPYVIERAGKPIATIDDGDAIIFFNLRSDRARQMSKPFVQPEFNKLNPKSFKRKKILKNVVFVAMTDFGPDLDSILTAFPSADIINTLPAVLKNIKQLYIAENEKYAHITYFFNGGYADPVDDEDRVLISSPAVPSYDKTPAMSTYKITERVIKSLSRYQFIAINFAIPDMVGHTGNMKATTKSVEAVDACVGKLYHHISKLHGTLVITSDHGNAERKLDVATGEMYTEHTVNPVPFILIESKKTPRRLRRGRLCDVAPTIIKLLKIPKPKEMTGKALF